MNALPDSTKPEIERYLERREQVHQRVSLAIKALEEAVQMAPQFALEPALRNFRWYSASYSRELDKLSQEVDRAFWRSLLIHSKTAAAVNNRQRDAIFDHVQQAAPPFDRDHVVPTMLAGAHGSSHLDAFKPTTAWGHRVAL